MIRARFAKNSRFHFNIVHFHEMEENGTVAGNKGPYSVRITKDLNSLVSDIKIVGAFASLPLIILIIILITILLMIFEYMLYCLCIKINRAVEAVWIWKLRNVT